MTKHYDPYADHDADRYEDSAQRANWWVERPKRLCVCGKELRWYETLACSRCYRDSREAVACVVFGEFFQCMWVVGAPVEKRAVHGEEDAA